jgi:uncharacterized membrane protein YozB (DUF420 family)
MKELFGRPGFLGTHGTFGADLSFLMALLFTILFIIGWRMAKKRQGNAHHTLTLWAMVSMLIYFTVYYLAQGLGALATEGREGFGGPEWMYKAIFSPLLTVHILVVSVGLIMAFYMIVLGFRTAIRKNGDRVLQAGSLTMSLNAFLKLSAVMFVIFAILGIARCCPDGVLSVGRSVVYVVGFLLVIFVIGMEKVIEKWFPDGERRHRKVGAFTMVLYVIALITSATTYVMLYVIYPPAKM